MQLPSVADYRMALAAALADAPDGHRAMLVAHLNAEEHRITATELARAAGYVGYEAANLQYGKLARRVCEALHVAPPVGNSGEPTFTYVLATSMKMPNQDWVWTLHEVVVEALQTLDSSNNSDQNDAFGPVHADEVPENPKYLEGAVIQRLVNARERDPEARAACVEYWGTTCAVCELDASEVYGIDPLRFIHVHHLQPLSTLTTPTLTDPKRDLRPVCPNCHTVLHTTQPPLSISALRDAMRK